MSCATTNKNSTSCTVLQNVSISFTYNVDIKCFNTNPYDSSTLCYTSMILYSVLFIHVFCCVFTPYVLVAARQSVVSGDDMDQNDGVSSAAFGMVRTDLPVQSDSHQNISKRRCSNNNFKRRCCITLTEKLRSPPELTAKIIPATDVELEQQQQQIIGDICVVVCYRHRHH
jgi:hypothetical protein